MPTDEIHTRTALLERASAHAETVPLDVELETVSWEISARARRRAGQCRYDEQTGEVTIRLTWAAFEAYGWEQFSGVVRHELVHAWEFQQFGESSHGPRFRAKAGEVDAPRRCEPFTDGRLVLTCVDDRCDWRAERHRASAVVTKPTRYRCGACRSKLVVTHVQTAESWRTNDGYEDARARIGAEW
ncbi:SprT-like domain-containing protein [Haladaptatus sp. YSMS36]|uniref:SprT family zinc-dependent metalloprotease n=1 Tax=Haladaptatus sp. YSMS36 TaxID=3033384 RepID=UPI0023E84E24|nr:SprT-like domain-containing protein [Haladaptatus sp. YSMS36]